MTVSFGVSLRENERSTAHDSEAQWYACYTRARHEKKIDQLLGERGIGSYLPVISRLMQWKDRQKSVSFVMFPSYVFARFSLDDLSRVLAIPGVADVVRTDGRTTHADRG